LTAIAFIAPARAGETGPSSSAAPYLVPEVSGVNFTSIITAGDQANDGYIFGGIPDGLGAFDNGNGTFTVLVNHEIQGTDGNVRAQGGTGAYVSQLVIDKNTLQVTSGKDLIQSAYQYNSNAPGDFSPITGAALNFSRFCSADLAQQSAYYNATTGLGTQNLIFANGEENGNGRGFAHVVTGSDAGKSFVLPWASPNNNTTSWENFLANPSTGDKTVVISNSDGGQNGVYVYTGNKSATGNDVEKAGLIGGQVYRVDVNNNAPENRDPNAGFGLVNKQTTFSLVANTNTGTSFLRPEDGAWDPKNPNVYYFATTDRPDAGKDNNNNPDIPQNQIGRSRLWQLTFNDINNAASGGTIKLILDGTLDNGDYQMFDNFAIDKDGNFILSEDIGNNIHNGKVWYYNPSTGQLTKIAGHDVALFGDFDRLNGVVINGSITKDEETTGEIDVTSLLGRNDGQKYFLIADQVHKLTGDPATVEGGQLLLVSQAAPEPSTVLGGLTALGFVAGIKRQLAQKKANRK